MSYKLLSKIGTIYNEGWKHTDTARDSFIGGTCPNVCLLPPFTFLGVSWVREPSDLKQVNDIYPWLSLSNFYLWQILKWIKEEFTSVIFNLNVSVFGKTCNAVDLGLKTFFWVKCSLLVMQQWMNSFAKIWTISCAAIGYQRTVSIVNCIFVGKYKSFILTRHHHDTISIKSV